MLYENYKRGRCGITLAAQPESSNHEGGRAVDTSYYSYWTSPLPRYGWVHSYRSSAAANIDSKNLLAFQRLWNRYNPGNQISEDGVYGPQKRRVHCLRLLAMVGKHSGSSDDGSSL